MGAVLKDCHLALADAILHRIRETGRGDNIVVAESDLRRSFDLGKRRSGIVRDYCFGLVQESFERLNWTSANESGERLDVVRLRRVEAPV